MTTNPWGEEVKLASAWWIAEIRKAIDRAFPTTTLFTFLASELRKESNMHLFAEEFCVAVDADFERRKVAWNPELPLFGAIGRRVGIEGAFRSEPIKIAAKACGLDDVLPYIPDGCVTQINPGKVFACTDRRDRGVVIYANPVFHGSEGGG